MHKETLQSTSHRRYNILTGEWILVSPQRTKRPWQGKQEVVSNTKRPTYDEDCYLCPGNSRSGGELNPKYETVFVFQNDFAALLEDVPNIKLEEGLLKAKSEKGICKVVCFSPDHSKTLPLMSVKDIVAVVSTWQTEYVSLGARKGIHHVQIFENKGATMGCSNPHPHGQIWAQTSIPEEVMKKTKYLKKFWKSRGKNLLLEYVHQELELKERIVAENIYFVALVPYWAVWPYEVMIVPKNHLRDIGELSVVEKTSFAQMIKHLTTKYDNLFQTSFPYSSGIHQRPTDGKEHNEWQFHMSFYPPLLRSASVKKFMVGYEMFANPQRDITAEQAA